MSGWTKGPWIGGLDGQTVGAIIYETQHTNGPIIAHVYGETPEIVSRRMDLFAAAPEMAELIGDWAKWGCNCEDGPVCAPCKARALLARIKGEGQ